MAEVYIVNHCHNIEVVMGGAQETHANGNVDPETLYTKQACIGGGSFGKVYKG